MIYRRFYPSGSLASEEYCIYDLTSGSKENRQLNADGKPIVGTLVYPFDHPPPGIKPLVLHKATDSGVDEAMHVAFQQHRFIGHQTAGQSFSAITRTLAAQS